MNFKDIFITWTTHIKIDNSTGHLGKFPSTTIDFLYNSSSIENYPCVQKEQILIQNNRNNKPSQLFLPRSRALAFPLFWLYNNTDKKYTRDNSKNH